MTNINSLINKDSKVCVVGLGYVGLPLVVALSRHVLIVGYDIDPQKVEELNKGNDPNDEADMSQLVKENVTFTTDPIAIKEATVYIVTVPTPITKNKTPNLTPLESASSTLGDVIAPGNVIIFESTVFPGCTEEVCIPILEQVSGLKAVTDFKVGYSPERINPGDKIHTLSNTIKIVSGIDSETLEFVSALYELIIEAGVHQAESIKVAEAAKIVENVQRDLNIALVNELALIFDRMDINTHDVINAAGTKWNFHKYFPGLVGGHCISVDPYYLTYKSQELGYYPQVILSGREVNEKVGSVVAKKVIHFIIQQSVNLSDARVLILGITFKENVRDIRNSRVIDVIRELQSYNIDLDIVDPYADDEYLSEKKGIELTTQIKDRYHCIVAAVKHKEFLAFDETFFSEHLHPNGYLLDIKGMYKTKFDNIKSWTL